jgi:hypothetical protein
MTVAHPHVKLNLPTLRGISLNPILFTQVPKLEAVSTKLLGTLDGLELPDSQKENLKTTIAKQMIPYLQARLSKEATASSIDKNSPSLIDSWTSSTSQISQAVPPLSLFPLVDLWRLAFLVPEVAGHLSASPVSPLPALLKIAADSTSSNDAKNLTLTALRLACNIFSNVALARRILSRTPYPGGSIPRDILTSLLIPALLSDVPNVRVAAASLAFNVSAFLQVPLMASFNKGQTGQMTVEDAVDDLDWIVEILSAVVEAVGREDSEDSREYLLEVWRRVVNFWIVHRLTTCLGLLAHLSPHLEEVRSLLEVLQVKNILHSKLGEKDLVKKQLIRELVLEVANELC